MEKREGGMAASITGPYFTLRGFMNGYQLLI